MVSGSVNNLSSDDFGGDDEADEKLTRPWVEEERMPCGKKKPKKPKK